MRYRLQRLYTTLIGGVAWINKHSAARIGLILGAILFAVLSLIISDRLVKKMAQEERIKMEVWAQAIQAIGSSDSNKALIFPLQIIASNKSIPVIVTDMQGQIQSYNNIELPESNPEKVLYKKLEEFRRGTPPIIIESSEPRFVYYSDSTLLSQLVLFPYVQLFVFMIILGISVLAVISLKRADQNLIWQGLSKETAHQLGTPISSLMAWREILDASGTDPMIIAEMGKDIERLEIIADRFQKIGSTPILKPTDLGELLRHSVSYMKPRISPQVELKITTHENIKIDLKLCEPLIAWVFENLIKNAVDAMQGKGSISISYKVSNSQAIIDVSDTGRGIKASQFETIFRPGYTTRTRGWGLGLSLARRIIEEYHRGQIFVKHSQEGEGTTFRILLPLYAEAQQSVNA